MMKLTKSEENVLYSYGCVDKDMTVQRISLLAALSVNQETKKMFVDLIGKLAEGYTEDEYQYMIDLIHIRNKFDTIVKKDELIQGLIALGRLESVNGEKLS